MDIAQLKAELERLHGASFGWALSCCRRDHALAEDVLQTVYLKILQGKAHYRYEANFKAWLFAVIRKIALTEQRKAWLRSVKSISDSKAPPERTYSTHTAASNKRLQQTRHEPTSLVSCVGVPMNRNIRRLVTKT